MKALKDQFSDPATLETRARRVVESMALCLQGSLLVRHAPPAVADAFCASRLGGDGGLEYGTLPAGSDFEAIIARSPSHRPPEASAAPAAVAAAIRTGSATAGPTIETWRHASNFQLARIFGIRIGVSDQLVRRAVLLHPHRHPHTSTKLLGGSRTTAYLVAVAAVLSYFASLILHELGHALVARRIGLDRRRDRPVVLRRPDARREPQTPARSSTSRPPARRDASR